MNGQDQFALVADDFNYVIQNLESESKNFVKNDPNKYVVRKLTTH